MLHPYCISLSTIFNTVIGFLTIQNNISNNPPQAGKNQPAPAARANRIHHEPRQHGTKHGRAGKHEHRMWGDRHGGECTDVGCLVPGTKGMVPWKTASWILVAHSDTRSKTPRARVSRMLEPEPTLNLPNFRAERREGGTAQGCVDQVRVQ